MQTDVGIRKQHCQNIVRHLAELQRDDETAAAALANPNRRITLCVEGNISAGKSSFLQRILKGSVELRDIVEVQTPLPLIELRVCSTHLMVSASSLQDWLCWQLPLPSKPGK